MRQLRLPSLSGPAIGVLIGVWLLLCVGTFIGLAAYQSEAGPAAHAAASWPETSRLPVPRRATALLFLHPECGCSRATLAELQRLRPMVGRPHDLWVVFSAPGDALRARVEGLREVRIVEDPEAVEARRFGATTSGHFFVFEAGGRLCFHGGITGARGHEGANAGSRLATRALGGKGGDSVASTTVFGCPLFDDGAP